MPRRIPEFFLMLLLAASAVPAPADDARVLSADTWAQPRNAAVVAAMPPVRDVLAAWREAPGQTLVIRHAGGEAGSLWARDLRNWLIALGVAGERIELHPGGEAYQLELLLE